MDAEALTERDIEGVEPNYVIDPKTGNLEPIRDGGYNRALAFVEINSKWVEVKQ